MNWKERMKIKSDKYIFVTRHGEMWEGVRKIVKKLSGNGISVNGTHGRRGIIVPSAYRTPTISEILAFEEKQ